MKSRVRISKGGQISIPSRVRHRWQTRTLFLDDQDERLVLEPAPDDPIDAAAGALAEYFEGFDVGAARREARAEERAAEERRLRG